jgi:hypothetical protein
MMDEEYRREGKERYERDKAQEMWKKLFPNEVQHVFSPSICVTVPLWRQARIPPL